MAQEADIASQPLFEEDDTEFKQAIAELDAEDLPPLPKYRKMEKSKRYAAYNEALIHTFVTFKVRNGDEVDTYNGVVTEKHTDAISKIPFLTIVGKINDSTTVEEFSYGLSSLLYLKVHQDAQELIGSSSDDNSSPRESESSNIVYTDVISEPSTPDSQTYFTCPNAPGEGDMEEPPYIKDLIPVLRNGDIDKFTLKAMFTVNGLKEETYVDYTHRIGVRRYECIHKVQQALPTVWNMMTLTLPEYNQEIFRNWYTSFQDHLLPFDDWWNIQGIDHTLIVDSMGNQLPARGYIQRMVNNAQIAAKAFIDEADKSVKDRLVAIYGAWSFGLTTEHFIAFSQFAQTDEEYNRLLIALAGGSDNSSDSASLLEMDGRRCESRLRVDDKMPFVPVDESKLHDLDMKQAFQMGPKEVYFEEKIILQGKVYDTLLFDPKYMVTPEMFLPGGCYAHVYIPNYPYVPRAIEKNYLGSGRYRPYMNTEQTRILWERLHSARAQAAHMLQHNAVLWGETVNPTKNLRSQWVQAIRERDGTQCLHTIDEVQHSFAHVRFKTIVDSWDEEDVDIVVYDLFIRPMERLFANNMPMAKLLLMSRNDIVMASWLKAKILFVAGVKCPPLLERVYMLHELSKIRMISAQALADFIIRAPYSRMDPYDYTYSSEDYTRLHARYDRGRRLPQSSDFYPGGKLHNIYVSSSEDPPLFVQQMYSRKTMDAPAKRLLSLAITLARAEYCREVLGHVRIQAGAGCMAENWTNEPGWIQGALKAPTAVAHHLGQFQPPTRLTMIRTLPLTKDDFEPIGCLPQLGVMTPRKLTPSFIGMLGLPNDLTSEERDALIAKINAAQASDVYEEFIPWRKVPDTSAPPEKDKSPLPDGLAPLITLITEELERVQEKQAVTKRPDSGTTLEDIGQLLADINRNLRPADDKHPEAELLYEDMDALQKKGTAKPTTFSGDVKRILLNAVSKKSKKVTTPKTSKPAKRVTIQAPPQVVGHEILMRQHEQEVYGSQEKPAKTYADLLEEAKALTRTAEELANLPGTNCCGPKTKQYAKGSISETSSSEKTTESDDWVELCKDEWESTDRENEKKSKRSQFFPPIRPTPKYTNKVSQVGNQAPIPTVEQHNRAHRPKLVATPTHSKSYAQVAKSPPAQRGKFATQAKSILNANQFKETSQEKPVKKVTVKSLGAPPKTMRTLSLPAGPLRPDPPKVFEPHPEQKNVFLWNGNRKDIPEWAHSSWSAADIGNLADNNVPITQAGRVTIGQSYRSLPVDGVNMIEDLVIKSHDGPALTTLILSANSKIRGDRHVGNDYRILVIALEEVEQLLSILHAIENAKLPPATLDSDSLTEILNIQKFVGTNFNYAAEVYIFESHHGQERLTRIVKETKEGEVVNGIAFPWRFTTLVNIKLEAVYREAQLVRAEKDSQLGQPTQQTAKLRRNIS